MSASSARRAALAWPAWPTTSLRTYLVATMLIATVPLALLLAYQSLRAIGDRQDRLRADLARSASALAMAVERELDSSAEMLGVLAGELREPGNEGDLGAALLLRRTPLRGSWHSLVLIDDAGRVLFDTSAEQSPRALPDPEELRALATLRGPTVSPLLGTGGARPATAVSVPVQAPGAPPRTLVAWIEAARWRRLLDSAAPPPEGFLSIFDGDDRLIARTGSPPSMTGLTLPRPSREAMRLQATGVDRSIAIDGAPVLRAWQRLPGSGWGAAVAVRADPLDAAEQVAVVRAIGSGAASLLIGLSLALLLARRLIRPLDAMAGGAPAAAMPASRVREVEALRLKLARAAGTEAAARARLEAKAADFETLFQASPIGLAFAQDPQCRSVVHNAAMDALFGQSAGGAGSALSVRHEGRPLPREQQPLQRAASLGEAVSPMELEIVAPERPTTVVLAHAVPLLDADGTPRGAIGAAVDITQRKRFEAQLLTTDRRLRESQRLIDLAQEAGHVGFFSYEFDTDVLTWSPGQAQLFGLAATTISLAQWVQRIDGEHRVRVEEQLRAMLAARQERGTLDYRVGLSEGEQRWLSSRVLVRYAGDDGRGRPQQMIGVTVDMTEQKEVERERAGLVEREQAARREAERANQAKDEFLAMLGHELRNPLGAISSAVEVMQRSGADSRLAGEAREIVARQTRNLARIMDDLLDVARLISGKVALARQPLDLGALVERVVATLHMTGQARQHLVELDTASAWIDADATRIEQVVTNLLTNALKYTRPGSRIEVGVRAHEGHALLRVRDNGDGIPPQLLPHVFDLFVQGERTLDRRAGGLGVGLTLVQRLVVLHGGSVEAESSPQGSLFEVRLPLVEPPLAPRADAVPDGALRGRHVVVVEDNDDALRSLRATLELDGHRVDSATDGPDGLRLILATRPDIAIVDLGLPGITGYEVALRSRRAGFGGLMVATSGYGQDSDAARARQAGFDTLLVKPLDRVKLGEFIRQAS